jgi:hypothetical protein
VDVPVELSTVLAIQSVKQGLQPVETDRAVRKRNRAIDGYTAMGHVMLINDVIALLVFTECPKKRNCGR